MMVNRKMKSKIWAVVLGMILTLILIPQYAHAAVAIDVGADVSLKIEYKKDGVKIEGAAFDVYKVAEVSESVEFTKTEEFSKFIGTFEKLDQSEWAKRAKEAVDFVESHEDIEPLISGKTDKDGVVSFPDEETEMTTGLYLVVGHECEIRGVTYKCSPFFICLPNLEETDQWNYNETALPKATDDSEKEIPKDSRLPQTGMLKWPIPVLAGTGLVFFMIGWAKRQKEEK